MRTRLLSVALVVVLLAVVIPVAVVLAQPTTGRYDGALDKQRGKFRISAVATTSTAWTNVPTFKMGICSIGEVSATLSVTVSGAPVRFRILGEQGNVIEPGPARFVPNGSESFSYTFITSTGTFEADDKHALQVQWQSATGGTVTLSRGDLNVLYGKGTLCS